MLRTFNYTGRERIRQQDVKFRVKDSGGATPCFEADFQFSIADFPEDASLYVEAYYKTTRQRFSFGTVSKQVPPEMCRLDKVDLSGPPLFRVLVVDETSRHALLLASGEGFRAVSEESDNNNNRSSILNVIARPLGGLCWRVDFEEGSKPSLVLNISIPNVIEKMRSDVTFQALVLPGALSQVLENYFLTEEPDEDGSTYMQWKAFAMMYAEQDPDDLNMEEKSGWIDDVISEFARHFDFANKLAEHLREAD